jgi:hypothetical protein
MVNETTRLEPKLRTVVAANARPLMGVGKISLKTNHPTTIEMKVILGYREVSRRLPVYHKHLTTLSG